VKVLKRFAREIKRKLPVDPKQKLEGQLQRAIKRENYELAAKLRDQIKQMIDGGNAASAPKEA
jgi:protein-arginine kinase activator protein McsA